MILLAHNRYRSASPSGENIVQEREQALLTASGVIVEPWLLESDALAQAGLWAQMRAAWQLNGSLRRRQNFAVRLRQLQQNGATLIHLHNPWPLFTYDLALAAQDVGLPLVQTLHNYRLIATNTHLVVQGRLQQARGGMVEYLEKQGRCGGVDAVSENQVFVDPRSGLRRFGSNHGLMANMAYNRALRHLWAQEVPQKSVAKYVCLTPFQQRVMIAAGIPTERTVVVPNFLDHQGPVGSAAGDYAVFVGRLDATKGIDHLMSWWPVDGPELRVIGDGPLSSVVQGHPRVRALGRLPFAEVQKVMAEAQFLVMNSTGHETFGLVLIEALAAGTPCLVPNLGGMPDIIRDGVTGVVFPAGDAVAAATAARRLWDTAPSMRVACRAEYESLYSPERHFEQLRRVYAAVTGKESF